MTNDSVVQQEDSMVPLHVPRDYPLWVDSLIQVIDIALITFLFPIWNGYVISLLWSWFLVPLNVPALSLPLSIGLCLISNTIFPSAFWSLLNQDQEEPDTSSPTQLYRKITKGIFAHKEIYRWFTMSIVIKFIGPGYLLLMGYIVHLFV